MSSRRTWLSITVELVEGRGRCFWPRPGRVFTAARHHTFAGLATAIDDAFSRWDRNHLQQFELFDADADADADFRAPPQRIGTVFDDGFDDDLLPLTKTKLSLLSLGQQFVYTFDLGDDWTHLCTVGEKLVDPLEVVGITTSEMPGPLPYWGWGTIPDQYDRRWSADPGDEASIPPNPNRHDLPPLRPHWGPNHSYPT